jgi:hypothetical protein
MIQVRNGNGNTLLLVGSGGDLGNCFVLCVFARPTFQFYIIASSVDVNDGQWHHVVIVSDESDTLRNGIRRSVVVFESKYVVVTPTIHRIDIFLSTIKLCQTFDRQLVPTTNQFTSVTNRNQWTSVGMVKSTS